MAKPMKVHTIESLYEDTEEYGECRIWTAYIGNGTPMVYHQGRMYSVRKLLTELSGLSTAANFFGCTCGDNRCVALEHIVRRKKTDHMRTMTKNSAKTATCPIRCAKISAAKRKAGKLSLTDMAEIVLSNESGPDLAGKYGVTRSRINQVKRGIQPGNPFAGLMR